VEAQKQAVLYHGPSPEVPVAPDSHLMLSRGDPSYLWWGSYSRSHPTGFKTIWALKYEPESLMPLADPYPLFDQRPCEFINHYYPVADCHVQMPLYQYTQVDSKGVPTATTRPGNVSRAGAYIPYLLDIDLCSGMTKRWPFPGQPPLHFQRCHAGDLWAGDCADPGFLWFEGRDAMDLWEEKVDPARCPAIPGDHSHHWLGSGAWIGVFRLRGSYIEVRPLVRHDTEWASVHPHPVFSPDDRWIAYASGNSRDSQIFVAEAVWPAQFT
ncbi:MAG: hypothetical protein HOE86_22015, partial [Gemmatimonadetes bacterium]|nr:hypothetical protein [Gemmatimonadota bacterium]